MKYAINARRAPETQGPYSQGTTAGRLVFTSGVIAVTNDPEVLIEGGIAEQTLRVIEIIELILDEVGCTLDDVAQTTVYVTDLDDIEVVNKVYEHCFPMPAPSRSVVGVSSLPLGALIEMDCIACR